MEKITVKVEGSNTESEQILTNEGFSLKFNEKIKDSIEIMQGAWEDGVTLISSDGIHSNRKIRGFELVSKEQYESTDAELPYEDLTLPKRSTQLAAGYDVISTKTFTLKVGETITVPTGFKAYMQSGEMLALVPRSGVGFKFQIQLANTIGIGDGDYYNCEGNEGHYFVRLVNRGTKNWEVKAGDRIVQAMFMPILLADGDSFETGELRTGGFGSTDK